MEKTTSRNKYLLKNTIIFSIGNFSTKLISFFLVPIYTYVLSTQEYGTIDLVFSICSIITPLIMCNIGEAIKRYSLDKDSDDDAILTTAWIWIFVGFFLTTIMIPLFRYIDIIYKFIIYIYIYILVYSTNTVFVEYLRGKEKLVSYTICNIITTFFIALFNICFLVHLKLGINGYFLAYILGYLISMIMAIVLGKPYKVIGKWKFDKKLFVQMSKFSIVLVPNALLWWIINSSDRIMISYLIGADVNGIYTVSYKIPSLITTFSTISMQAWQYSAIREKNSKDKIEYNNKMFNFYLALTVLVSAILIILVKPILFVYVSKEYFSAWLYSPILILGFTFLTLATFVGTSYYVEKDMKGNLISAFIGAICNIVLNLVLIPKYYATGAAIATCLSYFVVFIYRSIDTQKYLKLKILAKSNILNIMLLLLLLYISYKESIYHYIYMLATFIVLCFCNRAFIISILKKVIKIIKNRRKAVEKGA